MSTSTDAAGLYGPTSEAWALNREAFLLLAAGPRALLLQLAHPLIAEGVDQHSDFRADPWRRLSATLESYLAIVYGSTARARAEIRRLNALHRSIRGPVRDQGARQRHGRSYNARDPDLSMWVHATLVDSTIVAADAWLAPLSRQRRERYYQETRPIGRAFGIPDSILPADYAGFETYLARMLAPDGPVQVSETARALAPHVLRPPLGPVVPWLGWVPRDLYSWMLWPAIGLLPDRVRQGYGLPWGVVQQATRRWLVAGYRWWRPWFPTAVRWMPQALAADRRVAGGELGGGEGRSPS